MSKFDNLFMLVITFPICSLIPIVNMIFYFALIEDILDEAKSKKISKKRASKNKVDDLEDFAYHFGSKYWNRSHWEGNEFLGDVNARYYYCLSIINNLKSEKYKTINDMHNKGAEGLFIETMALIKECYEKNTMMLCQTDILESLILLSDSLKLIEGSYENEYIITLNSTKQIYKTRFSKLNEKLKTSKNFSEIYNKEQI
ncbi:hypothetical protein [Clostridium tagluense]|nr:hypothetical protein [Clostridium tagluense]